MKELGLFAAGVLFGTAGIKLLGSRDADVYKRQPVARWGLRFLELTPDAKVLDCGCGGGAVSYTHLPL